jgi:hypothetical protein
MTLREIYMAVQDKTTGELNNLGSDSIPTAEIITWRRSWSFIEMFTERATTFRNDTIRISI